MVLSVKIVKKKKQVDLASFLLLKSVKFSMEELSHFLLRVKEK
ncbi:hypothetical protein [Streptococcus equinus]|nr:hypothetical protein [Streptococcus equinus]